MKKKLTILLGIFLIITLVSCGNYKDTSINDNTNNLSSMEDNKYIPEDDYIISWQDPALADIMKDVTGIANSDICYEHVKDITHLNLDYTDNGDRVQNTIALKYLTNLTNLNISAFNGEVVELHGLKNLKWVDFDYTPLHFVDMDGQTISIHLEEITIDGNDFTYTNPDLIRRPQ